VRALGSADEHRCGLREGRVHVVREAMALVQRGGQHAPSVSDLCRRLAVTERTLERSFRDVVGTTPKSYIQAQRLTGVRRALREADPSTTRITDVANEWGFWHMGQFAADYRRHFDERPSETLERQVPDAAR
jgi:AraC family ethanolamine operon transcriptional activator